MILVQLLHQRRSVDGDVHDLPQKRAALGQFGRLHSRKRKTRSIRMVC